MGGGKLLATVGGSLVVVMMVACVGAEPTQPRLPTTPPGYHHTNKTAAPVENSLKDRVTIAKDITQIIAVIIAAIWASYRFGLFRDPVPHGVISHEITHRPLTNNTVHISVTVIFSNTGRVVWSFKPEYGGYTLIQLVKPIMAESLERLHGQVMKGEFQDYQWPSIDERGLADRLQIEPSDTGRLNYEFVLSDDIETVVVYSHYPRGRRWVIFRSQEGWDATTTYDLTL